MKLSVWLLCPICWAVRLTAMRPSCWLPCSWLLFVRQNRFEIKNEIDNQGQSSPESIGTLTELRCILVQNWWWLISRTSSKWDNFLSWMQFDLKGQDQLPHKTIRTLTKVFYIYGPNFVILVWTVDELSRGQVHDWHRHTHTHATTTPKGQNWHRVKKVHVLQYIRQEGFVWRHSNRWWIKTIQSRIICANAVRGQTFQRLNTKRPCY